jgi:hypothetical protein
MDIRPLAVGLILFGLLVLGGTLDGARRKLAERPDWVAMNWRSVVRGLIGWCVLGGLALLGGIVGVLL